MIALLLLIMAPALAHDHAQWQAVLDRHRSPQARLDYAELSQDPNLSAYIAGLASAEVPADKPDQLAFWINAYNALTVDVVAQNWPIGSIKEIDQGKVWTQRNFRVAGRSLTLDQIQKQTVIPLGGGRAHMALNCASLGCPPLPAHAFTGANIEAQLSAVTTAWIAHGGATIDPQQKTVILSPIFDWYANDFPNPGDSPIPGVDLRLQGSLSFIAKHLGPEQSSFILAGGYQVSFGHYDWKVNAP